MLYNVLLAFSSGEISYSSELLSTLVFMQILFLKKKTKPSAYFFHVCFTTTNLKLHFFLY